jgi:hypothetical protein
MGYFSGVVFCFSSELLSYTCKSGACICLDVIVGVVCLWSWAAIRSPALFEKTGKWQTRMTLTLFNPKLYRKTDTHSETSRNYPEEREAATPDWLVAVNMIFTIIGFALFVRALHVTF